MAGLAPALGLAICQATPVNSAAARATASATTTKRLRETTDDRVISPSSELRRRQAGRRYCVAPNTCPSRVRRRAV